jgi:multiple sugar transport system permease protein
MKAAECQIWEIRAAGAACLPGFALCYLLPFGMTVWYAFIRSAFDHRFAGLDNFIWVLQNKYFALGSVNLVLLGGIMMLLSFALILFLAPLLLRHPKIAKLGAAILILPLLIPSISAVTVWKRMFDTNALLNPASSRWALITLFLWKYSGIGSVLLWTELRMIPAEILDAAALDGAGKMKAYLFIQLPLSGKSLILAGMVLLMFLLRVYKESYLLFGAYPSPELYLLQHYMNHQYLKMNFQYVAAAAVILTMAALLFYAAAFLLIKKRKEAP